MLELSQQQGVLTLNTNQWLSGIYFVIYDKNVLVTYRGIPNWNTSTLIFES